MKKLGVFVDVSNIYYSVQYANPKYRPDFANYLTYCKALGRIDLAIAYGAYKHNEAASFIRFLTDTGYTPKYKKLVTVEERGKIRHKADWDVGIALDIFEYLEQRPDMIILGTGDSDLVPIARKIKDRGIDLVVLAYGISKELSMYATKSIELPKSMLLARKRDESENNVKAR